MPNVKLSQHFLPVRAVKSFSPKTNLATASFFRFLFSHGIGNSWQVLFDRFTDLTLLRPFFESKSVIEFGTGSSTAFFLNHARPGFNLISYEQDLRYLPKYIFADERTRAVISDVVIEKYESFKGSKFISSQGDISGSDFVYVDGPVSPFDADRGMAGPNLDLMSFADLKNKVVAVDRRHLTVLLLLDKLTESHFFVPTKRFLEDVRVLGLNIDYEVNLRKCPLQLHTFERTCVFVPKS